MPNRLSVKDATQLAKDRRGRLLSLDYKNNSTDLKWSCDTGHVFFKPLKRVKNGEWCPYCSGKYVVYTPQQLTAFAAKYRGKCFAQETVKTSDRVKWSCDNGHEWSAVVFNVVSNGSWCPKCKNNSGEEIARYIFEKLTEMPFKKSRPSWLKVKSGRCLELDGYNETLGIAFEHQGRQHSSNSSSFFADKNILERDQIKRELCLSRGVRLIEIPEIPNQIGIEEAINLVRSKLADAEVPIKGAVSAQSISENLHSVRKSKLQGLREIASQRNGELLSKSYLGHIVPLLFRCERGHEWHARPNDIVRGSWCSKCSRAGGKRKTIDDLNQLVKEQGIRCISEIYVNSKAKLVWACDVGHSFSCRYDYLLSYPGCPRCRDLIKK